MATERTTSFIPDPDDYATFVASRLLEGQRAAFRDQAIQSRADRELEHRASLAKRGQGFGLASLFLILATVITLALTTHDWVAGCVGVPGVFSIIGIFVTGKYQTSTPETSSTLPEIPRPSPPADAIAQIHESSS
jgi:hypothetical protein